MTHDEIRAQIDELRLEATKIQLSGGHGWIRLNKAAKTIEALLAREVEAINYTHQCGIIRTNPSGERIRAILNPETMSHDPYQPNILHDRKKRTETNRAGGTCRDDEVIPAD